MAELLRAERGDGSGGPRGEGPGFWQSTLSSARGRLTGLSPGNGNIAPSSARDLYSSLPQHEHEPLSAVAARDQSCAESMACSTCIATVIMANTVVIGLECQHLNEPSSQEYYARFELIFCVIYLVELLIRCCASGLSGFFCPSNTAEWGWNIFDFITVVLGTLSVVFSQVKHVHLNASVLRLLRVLRILRVFRILKFMKDVEYTLVSAMWSMLRIMFLVLMIVFIGAVMITHLLDGTPDDVVAEMFGNLSSSMYHLFIVMVDGMSAMHVIRSPDLEDHMVVITEKVTSVHPHMAFFWIAFVFVGTISLMALVPAIFVELNLRDAEQTRKKQMKEEWERRVETQRAALELVFQAADKDKSNTLTRQEVECFLQEPDIMKQVGLDVESDEEDEAERLDIKQLRMEFSMVYDTIEAEGRHEMTCSEFIEAFRHMRKKPMDQVVLTLQQEIFKLRALMSNENQQIMAAIRRLSGPAEEVRGRRSERHPDSASAGMAAVLLADAARPSFGVLPGRMRTSMRHSTAIPESGRLSQFAPSDEMPAVVADRGATTLGGRSVA